MRNIFKSLLICLFFVSSLSLFSYEVILDFEPPEVEKGPVLTVVPFSSTAMVGEELEKELYDAFLKRFIKENNYKVKSIMGWLDKKYGDNSFSSVGRLLNNIVRGRMPVNKLCWGNIVYLEGEYLFTFYWYDIKSHKKSMYQRIFKFDYIRPLEDEVDEEFDYVQDEINYRQGVVSDMVSSIFDEFNLRNETEKRLFSKNVLIRKTKVKYYNYTRLSTGLEEYSEIPFIQYKDTPLQHSEDIFSGLFEYSFYKSGVVYEHCDSLGNYLKKKTPILTSFNYVVDSELKISNDFSILKITVRNPKWPPDDNIVITYSFPLKEVNFKSLQELAQKNSQLVLLNLLNENELKKVGIVNLKDSSMWVRSESEIQSDLMHEAEEVIELLVNKEPIVYVNNIYHGPLDRLSSQILPFGSNSILEDLTLYKVFVSPFWMNSIYFSETDSLLMEKN